MLNRCYGLVMTLSLLGGLLSQVYIPFPDVNIYFLECAILAVWMIADAMERGARLDTTLGWAVVSLAVAPIVIPRWYANRPLKPGECRKGGVDANYFTAFGIITVLYTGVSAACNFLAFGPERGFELIINTGFAVAGTGLVLGLACRQDKVTERGPQLASQKVEELD